VKPVKFLGEIY